MTRERLEQLEAARERGRLYHDTEPSPARDDTLAAARVWLHAETQQSAELWIAIAAKAVLRGLDGEHVNAEAMGWLGKMCVRGDFVHRRWAQAVYRAIEERDIG